VTRIQKRPVRSLEENVKVSKKERLSLLETTADPTRKSPLGKRLGTTNPSLDLEYSAQPQRGNRDTMTRGGEFLLQERRRRHLQPKKKRGGGRVLRDQRQGQVASLAEQSCKMREKAPYLIETARRESRYREPQNPTSRKTRISRSGRSASKKLESAEWGLCQKKVPAKPHRRKNHHSKRDTHFGGTMTKREMWALSSCANGARKDPRGSSLPVNRDRRSILRKSRGKTGCSSLYARSASTTLVRHDAR